MALRDYRARLTGTGLELKVAFANGTTANNAITINGIDVGDVLVSVLEVQPPTASSGGTFLADRTSATTISGANTIKISQDTSGNQVLVLWWSV